MIQCVGKSGSDEDRYRAARAAKKYQIWHIRPQGAFLVFTKIVIFCLTFAIIADISVSPCYGVDFNDASLRSIVGPIIVIIVK